MEKIIVLYYSGVGNTKTIAKYMNQYLEKKNRIDLYSIEELTTDFSFDSYSKMVIGFPTIHCAPAALMMDFVQKIDKINKKLPTFVYTTCGLYSGNAIRIFCKSVISKNIVPIYTSSYRCPAIDGILLTPKIKRWYSYEKGLLLRIRKDLKQFLEMDEVDNKLPMLKWYSVLNYPNKVIGEHTKFKIYLHKEKCIRCGLCITNCPTKACVKTEASLPRIDNKKCINCYRCIHYCPQRALSLSKRTTPKKTLK